MTRYYFHVHDYAGFVLDEEGQELDDPAVLRREALRSAWSIMGEDVKQGCLDLRGRIEVTDPLGQVVMTLPFEEAVEIKTGTLS